MAEMVTKRVGNLYRMLVNGFGMHVGRRMLLELEATKVIAEDEHDNTRYALLELS